MTLRSISLRNFRNHKKTDIECLSGHNILVGRNGEGKTNILEAIAYICLGRSFYAATDAIVLQHGAEEFSVRGAFEAERGVVFTVDVTYNSLHGSRKIRVGGSELARRADLIGMFPVVLLSPDHATITSGGPNERRRMIDTTLGQAHHAYLDDVIEYRKALRQRNKMLLDAKLTRRSDPGALEPWTDVLIERGARITDRRTQFVEAFQPYVATAVGALSGSSEAATIRYEPSIGHTANTHSITTADRFQEHIDAVRQDEARAGTTLVGPHRDEFEFEINGLSVRQYASQGQHKTFLVGLKFAEFRFLKEVCSETPILLLDDVLSELDPDRNAHVFELTKDAGQVFLTAADERLLPTERLGKNNLLYVENGHARTSPHANATL